MSEDTINHPTHYTQHPSGVECITIAEHFNFNVGSAIKYIWRAGLKSTSTRIDDLRKAHWFIERELYKDGYREPAPEARLFDLFMAEVGAEACDQYEATHGKPVATIPDLVNAAREQGAQRMRDKVHQVLLNRQSEVEGIASNAVLDARRIHKVLLDEDQLLMTLVEGIS